MSDAFFRNTLAVFALALSFAIVPAHAEVPAAPVVASAAAPEIAHETAPDIAPTPLADAEVDQFMGWMGLSETLPAIVRSEMKKRPALASLSDAQQTCMIEVLTPPMRDLLREAFRSLLEDRETFLGWSEFADSDMGRKLFAFVRSGVQAKVDGTSEPKPEAFFADIGEQDQLQMMRFMMSPAARILSKPFPDVQPPAGMMDALEQDARERCGLGLSK